MSAAAAAAAAVCPYHTVIMWRCCGSHGITAAAVLERIRVVAVTSERCLLCVRVCA